MNFFYHNLFDCFLFVLFSIYAETKEKLYLMGKINGRLKNEAYEKYLGG